MLIVDTQCVRCFQCVVIKFAADRFNEKIIFFDTLGCYKVDIQCVRCFQCVVIKFAADRLLIFLDFEIYSRK